MSNNGMNYPMYNNLSYPHIVQPPSLYAQQYPNTLSQPLISPYGTFPSISSKSQYNTYDHFIQSTAKTLAAFTHPSELSTATNQLSYISQSRLFSRRPPNNSSSTNANSTRMYYCEICRIACGGHTSYQAHLNGTKHKKKEQNSQQQSTNNSNIYRCELCDITCTSSDAYQAHLDGNKHEKAMKLHRKLGKTIPENVVQESPLIVNNNEKISSCSITTENSNSKFIGMEYIETSYDESNIPKCYYCKLCDCKFHDANGRDAHLKGRRHRLSYKKKVDPNFPIESKDVKIRTNETIDKPVEQSIHNYHSQHSTELDDDTKYLMEFHQQIIPSQILLDTIENFVSAIENALKSCSDQLHSLSTSTTDQSPLMGVSRVGSLVKNLVIKTDRLFHIVIICTEWPTKNLFEQISNLLSENFQEQWINRIKIDCQKMNEIIQVTTISNEGQITVSIALTSLTIQEDNEQISDELLSKSNCLNALDAMHSVRWFQHQVSKRPYASALIRCLRYKSKTIDNWHSLSSEIIEILIEYILSEPKSPIIVFRQVLEYLSSGLILSNGPGLRIPWQNNTKKNVLNNLNDQERNDITHEAQISLRLLAFGQLNRWLQGNNQSQVQKRFYSQEDNQISSKRQCTALSNQQ